MASTNNLGRVAHGPAQCHIKRCSDHARWTLTTVGHPTGDIAVAYCQAHVWAPATDKASKPYSILIEGPADLTEADVSALAESASSERLALGVAR